jgi:hypothetical protein
MHRKRRKSNGGGWRRQGKAFSLDTSRLMGVRF